MTQRTLTQFGYKANNHDKTMCDFVLDYNTMQAQFTALTPTPSHRLHATIKNSDEGFTWRVWSFGERGIIYAPKTTENNLKWEAQILKSNLQKAIRLQDREAALSTTIQLALINKQELFRRLPIIAVEDVSLLEGTSTIIWLMMAAKNNISVSEMTFIARYVDGLCATNETFYNNKLIKTSKISHSLISNMPEVAALNIRVQYGGMKGDIEMLRRAVKYYIDAEAANPMLRIPELELPSVVSHDFVLLPQGIDFHPYPWIIGYIHNKTNIPRDLIKSIIWNAESGPNNRKIWTIDKQHIAKGEDIWPLINEYLGYARTIVIKKHKISACDA